MEQVANPKWKVEIIPDMEVTISYGAFEVVKWTMDEWLAEGEDLVTTIANAIRMVYEEPDRLLKINEPHIASQRSW